MGHRYQMKRGASVLGTFGSYAEAAAAWDALGRIGYVKRVARAAVVVALVALAGCAESTTVCSGPGADAGIAAFDPSSPTGSFAGQALALTSSSSPVGAAWQVDIAADGDGGFCLSWKGSSPCALSVLPFGQEAFRGVFDGAPFRFNTETWHAREVLLVTHYGRDYQGVVDVSIIADEGSMVWQLEQVTP